MEEGNGKKRRRREEESSFAKAYDGVTFIPVTASGRPGTPHRYFRESYTVHFANDKDESSGPPEAIACQQQVVHVHVNGLVVVTAGTLSSSSSSKIDEDNLIEAINFHVQVADVASQSAATKRKQKAKMLKGKKVDDSVKPMDHLATIKFKNENEVKEIQLRCCVWGSVIEINPNLSPSLLQEDPLLDGYLTVILPSGPFPPRSPENGESSSVDKKLLTSTSTSNPDGTTSRPPALATNDGQEEKTS